MEKLENCIDEKEHAMEPVEVICSPKEQYGDKIRKWQGIPGIERTNSGRLWVTFYSGGEGEGADNFVLLIIAMTMVIRGQSRF